MVILLILVLLVAGAGLFLLKKPAVKTAAPVASVAEGGLVTVRKVETGDVPAVEASADDIEGNEPVPMDLLDEREETLLDRYHRKDLTRVEREEVTDELRKVGYKVVSVDEWEDIHGPCPVVEASADVPSKGSVPSVQDDSSSGDGDEDDGSDDDGPMDMSGQQESGHIEVDPDSLMPLGEQEYQSDELPEEGLMPVQAEYPEDEYGLPVQGEDDVNPVVPEDDDDDMRERESALSLELMRFICSSRRRGLISEELVMFAQVRLRLLCPGTGMTLEELLVAGAGDYVYSPDPGIADLSLDDFDMYVRRVVEGNERVAQEMDAEDSREVTEEMPVEQSAEAVENYVSSGDAALELVDEAVSECGRGKDDSECDDESGAEHRREPEPAVSVIPDLSVWDSL